MSLLRVLKIEVNSVDVLVFLFLLKKMKQSMNGLQLFFFSFSPKHEYAFLSF